MTVGWLSSFKRPRSFVLSRGGGDHSSSSVHLSEAECVKCSESQPAGVGFMVDSGSRRSDVSSALVTCYHRSVCSIVELPPFQLLDADEVSNVPRH